MSQARFITPFESDWGAALAHCQHDIYHLPYYSILEANWIGAKPIAFVCESDKNRMLIPLLERETPARTGTDAVTPYGYSSPIFSPQCPDEFKRYALLAFYNAARERGIVSTFLRLHPLMCPSLSCGVESEIPEWNEISRGHTVQVPIGSSQEEWLAAMTRSHRAHTRKLIRANFSVEINTDRSWREFPAIYRETMKRVSAENSYLYDDRYFESARINLNSFLHCAAVVSDSGVVVSSGLFSLVSGIVQYHLGGTKSTYLDQSPMKLLFTGVRDWAQSRNASVFHLGGGLGARRDSLFDFKMRFGGQELEFRTVSLIHDMSAYQAECLAWQAKVNRDSSGQEKIFPLYRSPFHCPG